jgi:hypothetical protein
MLLTTWAGVSWATTGTAIAMAEVKIFPKATILL